MLEGRILWAHAVLLHMSAARLGSKLFSPRLVRIEEILFFAGEMNESWYTKHINGRKKDTARIQRPVSP